MYSALKREGVALYRLAREGVEVDRPPRKVQIHRLDLLDVIECECGGFPMLQVGVFVHCSKGTYVRVLAEDLGAMLGCGAHLVDLRRTRIGQLAPDRMFCLQELQALDPARRRAALLPVDHLIRHLPRVDLGAELAERFSRGQRLRLPASAVVEASDEVSEVRVYGAGSYLLGTGVLDASGRLAPQRLLASEVP
jgi:tRNA pseudouridine55 synthase